MFAPPFNYPPLLSSEHLFSCSFWIFPTALEIPLGAVENSNTGASNKATSKQNEVAKLGTGRIISPKRGVDWMLGAHIFVPCHLLGFRTALYVTDFIGLTI